MLALGINLYTHLVCQTPLFRATLHTVASDCRCFAAARGWAECVEAGSMEGYRRRFEGTAAFFRDRVPHAARLSAGLIAALAARREAAAA